MKKISILFIGMLLSACTTEESITLILENQSDQTRHDAGIVISRGEISGWAELNDTLYPVLKTADGTYIPSQTDDLDGDGSWDELFVVTDFAGNEIKEVSLEFVEMSSYPETAARTNIRFASKTNGYEEVSSATREQHANNAITSKVWQMEGPAWENDYIGFRNYFDQRNGVDIFGKVSNEMVLDKVGHHSFPSYHEYNPDWGMDVLKVGASLGAGSIAYLFNDSLYRVGDNGTGTYQALVEGPLRSIFRFEFIDWDMGGNLINVTHDISIQAGTFYYENKVSYSGGVKNLQLICGIVNSKSDELFEVKDAEKSRAFYTHDLQSLDTTLLGMGILVNEKEFIATSETPDLGAGITGTYCIHLSAAPDQSVTFRFYAVWEKQNEKWADKSAFEALLAQDAAFLSHPISYSRK
jgi:hypothetical protein